MWSYFIKLHSVLFEEVMWSYFITLQQDNSDPTLTSLQKSHQTGTCILPVDHYLCSMFVVEKEINPSMFYTVHCGQR